MGDYGHELLFGTFLTPAAADPHRIVALAQLAEQVGLDLVTVQDHPYQAKHLDTWTLLSAIAANTSTVSVATNVANLPLRPPAVLARSVATLDRLSGGRVELGLGAGAFWDAIEAVGGRRLTPGQAVQALEEGITVIRAMWDTGRRSVRVDGEFHSLRGAHPGPAPAHDVGIWVGAYKPRMLALTGRLADGWLPSSMYAAPEELGVMNARIDDAAVAAGRSPQDVRRLYNVSGSFDGGGTGFLEGPPGVWVEQLAGLALDEGVSGFVAVGDDPELLRRFAAEVAPAVREMVAAERDRPNDPEAPPASDLIDVPLLAGTVPDALGVTPTPDDGHRLSATRLWDEDSRPTGPEPDPDRTYTARQQAIGRHLVDVHDHLRQEFAEVRRLVDRVAAGELTPGAARSHVNAMTMRQNEWTLGAYCAAYCRVVTTHHTIEDVSVFPHLRRADQRLGPVIDRLEEEHRVIHEVLDAVDRALVHLVAEPDGMQPLRTAVDLLSDTLLSHLSYEERELVEPLARFGFG